MDELHGILIAYEMRIGNSNHKEVVFKALQASRKGKNCSCSSDDSDVETNLAQFVKKLKKGSKLKGSLSWGWTTIVGLKRWLKKSWCDYSEIHFWNVD